MHSFCLFILFMFPFFSSEASLASHKSNNRRILHEPFIPLNSLPPSELPKPPPPPLSLHSLPSNPKHPFSTTIPTDDNNPNPNQNQNDSTVTTHRPPFSFRKPTVHKTQPILPLSCSSHTPFSLILLTIFTPPTVTHFAHLPIISTAPKRTRSPPPSFSATETLEGNFDENSEREMLAKANHSARFKVELSKSEHHNDDVVGHTTSVLEKEKKDMGEHMMDSVSNITNGHGVSEMKGRKHPMLLLVYVQICVLSQRGESVKGKGILTNMNAWTGTEM